jgi:hypothetical protein
MDTGDQSSIDLIYEITKDRFAFLHDLADKIDGKANMYLVLAAAIVTVAAQAFPNIDTSSLSGRYSGIWIGLSGTSIISLSVTASIVLYRCIAALAIREYPSGPRVDKLITKYMSKDERTTASRVVEIYEKHCQEVQRLNNEKATHLRIVNDWLLPMLVFELILCLLSRVSYSIF